MPGAVTGSPAASAAATPAGQFEGSVEGAEAAVEDLEGVSADAADFTAGLGDGVDLLLGRGLGPGEGVEDGVPGISGLTSHAYLIPMRSASMEVRPMATVTLRLWSRPYRSA